MGGRQHPARRQVDRTDLKSYILPLLFLKRICDVWDEEHAAMLAEYGEDFADEHRFQVPEGYDWSKVRKAPKNVGTAPADAMRGVKAANQKHLYGAFGDAQCRSWISPSRQPRRTLLLNAWRPSRKRLQGRNETCSLSLVRRLRRLEPRHLQAIPLHRRLIEALRERKPRLIAGTELAAETIGKLLAFAHWTRPE